MSTIQPIRALIEAAYEGVRMIVCPRCRGWGVVGLTTMPAACPDCDGKGRIVTTTDERESA